MVNLELSVSTGHPELVATIASEIAASGPIPFARFMELALYHPQFGYYMRSTPPAHERIGWRGDFYTSSDVHPILGHALAAQAEQMYRLLGQPPSFTIVEMGPGKGLLAKHILETCAHRYRSFFQHLQYVLIDRSPAMREVQRRNLAPWLDRAALLTWADDLSTVAPHGLTGLLLSNELVDSFPVHRVQATTEGIKELWVDYRDGRFLECLKPLSSDALAVHLDRLGPEWPEGYRTEINLRAPDWMKEVAQHLDRGFVLTIDYGHSAQDLYRPDRTHGTFLCYFQQSIHEDPFLRVGDQDMTAHVDFSCLATTGEEQGLQTTGFTNQMSFLMGLGVEQMIAKLEQDSPEFNAAIHLLRPNGMGTTFKVLIQHKGLARPELDGLQYKPFFGSALTTQSAA
ncbi:MAG: class I SAM-dependent methyltransferase [Nitrospira sp.]|nr:MAG: class I SAM-dependent methyltransferase [Nitrospira sp.]